MYGWLASRTPTESSPANLTNRSPPKYPNRGAIMVLHIPGDIIGTPAFERTLDDVALMSLLGVKIVLVCGIAHQVNSI